MQLRLRSIATLCLLLSVARFAHAQRTDFHVVASYGDTREVTCLATIGEVLWIGTLGGGMVRAEGESRERLGADTGLPGQRVRDCASVSGVLWVATDAGVARFDAAARRFRLVQAGRFLRLAASGAQLMAADAHGHISRLQGDGLVNASSAELVPSALALADDGKRWAAGGMNGRVVSSDDSAALVVPPGASGHLEPIEQLRFDGAALVVSTTERVLRFEAGRVTSISQAAVAELPEHARVVAHAVWQGRELLGSDAGLYARGEHPGTDETWSPVELGAALPCGDRISALAVHRGALWIGSFDRGLCRFDGTSFTHIGAPTLPSDMIDDLVSDGERLYIATARGLSVLEPDETFHSYVHTACAGNLSGACPWYPAVNGVAFDAARGETWIADRGALHRIARDHVSWQHAPGSVLGSGALTRVAVHAGHVAIGTSDAGVLYGRSDRERIGALTRIDQQAGLADDWVTDLSFDARGALWVGTCTRGVSIREPSGKLSSLTGDDGLADDYTLSVNVIGEQVWIGTLRGVSIVSAGAGVLQTLGTRDGLTGDEVHDAVAWNGKVWLATDGGLSVLADDAPVTARYAP